MRRDIEEGEGLPLSELGGESVSPQQSIERARTRSQPNPADSAASGLDYDDDPDGTQSEEEADGEEENSRAVILEKDTISLDQPPAARSVPPSIPTLPPTFPPASHPSSSSSRPTTTIPPPSTSFATTTGNDSLASSQRPLIPPISSSSFLSHLNPYPRKPSSPSTTTKSSSKSISHKQLISLGYTGATLKRDYDFWSAISISICNIGFLPGTFLGVMTAREVGGSSMYTIGWPIAGLFMLGLVAVLAEMASTYPVAGSSTFPHLVVIRQYHADSMCECRSNVYVVISTMQIFEIPQYVGEIHFLDCWIDATMRSPAYTSQSPPYRSIQLSGS